LFLDSSPFKEEGELKQNGAVKYFCSDSIMLVAIRNTKNENGAFLTQPYLSFLRKQESKKGWMWIPACAGMTN
jgi:hypothetical protein